MSSSDLRTGSPEAAGSPLAPACLSGGWTDLREAESSSRAGSSSPTWHRRPWRRNHRRTVGEILGKRASSHDSQVQLWSVYTPTVQCTQGIGIFLSAIVPETIPFLVRFHRMHSTRYGSSPRVSRDLH